MIDTHAHLDALDDAGAALERAREAGVTRVLTVGAAQAVEIAHRHRSVHAIVGVHPHDAAHVHPHDAARADVDEIRRLLDDEKAVAVGEIGLDYYRDYAPRDAQRRLFAVQLALAAERDAPVVIHTRAADADTRAALESFGGTVVLHCFSSPQLLEPALERGWYVSFAGNVTYKSAADLRVVAAQVPADRILAETDSPYLAPHPLRGRPNEPAYVVHTLATLAQVRGEDPHELEQQIDRNATECFGL